MRSVRFVCHSVCVQPHAKIYSWIYIKFLPMVGLGLISRWFNFGGDPD